MRTVALYGGSFDPPHRGHEAVVDALNRLDFIDKIVIMPTYLNPFKNLFTAEATLRYRWLKEIFSEYKKVEVSSFEIDKKRKVPTMESVRELQKEFDTIYLVIGADNLEKLKEWYQFDLLEKAVSFIVASRNDITIPQDYISLHVDEKISSSALRKRVELSKLPQKYAKEIYTYYEKHKRNTMQKRVEKITEVLDTNKAEAIEVFDLREKNYIVDYAIIASSLGQKHTLALLDHLKKELKPEETFNNVDESGDWVAIDLGDILIHIMTPEYRVKYDMESFLGELES